jgi:hypothetical protein
VSSTVAWLALAVVVLLLGAGIFAVDAHDDRARERKVQRCLDEGGVPDIHGRFSEYVSCYERPAR